MLSVGDTQPVFTFDAFIKYVKDRVYTGAWKSLFSFDLEVNNQTLEMEQGCSEEHMLPKNKPTVSFPLSCWRLPSSHCSFLIHSFIHAFIPQAQLRAY